MVTPDPTALAPPATQPAVRPTAGAATQPAAGPTLAGPSAGGAAAQARTAGTGATLAVIAAGGAAGSVARYGVSLVLPHDAGVGVPWSTFAVNGLGCLLIGVLTVLVARAHPLLRPLLGIGFLGGFTTFSTYAVDAVVLLDRGSHGVAAAYVFGTLATALLGVTLGVAGTRWIAGRR